MRNRHGILHLRLAATLLVLIGAVTAVCSVGAWMVSGCCGSPEPPEDGYLLLAGLALAGCGFMAHQCLAEARRRRHDPSWDKAEAARSAQRTLRLSAVALAVAGVLTAAWHVSAWWSSGCCGSPGPREAGYLLVGAVMSSALWTTAWWCLARARRHAEDAQRS